MLNTPLKNLAKQMLELKVQWLGVMITEKLAVLDTVQQPAKIPSFATSFISLSAKCGAIGVSTVSRPIYFADNLKFSSQSSRPYGVRIFIMFLIILLPMFGASIQNGMSYYV